MAEDKKDKKERKEENKKEEKKPVKKISDDVHGIVRISGTDVDGTKKVRSALLKIKGIGQTMAVSVSKAAEVSPDHIMGKLPDEQVKKIEEVIQDPTKFGIPFHMINRRTDPATGKNIHMHGSDLVFTRKMDIDMMRKIRCYKGIRHEQGLPVRGQRTRSSFRTGTTAGVMKKAIKAKQERKK